MVRIFRLNDCDWWAAEDLESAKAACLIETGLEEEEAFDEPYQLSEAEMDVVMFTQDDGKKVSFRVELREAIAEGRKFPSLFASTEC